MKRKSKIAFGSIFAILSIVGLSSCTKSFCSSIDSSRMMYAFDPGITKYTYSEGDSFSFTDSLTGKTYVIENCKKEIADYDYLSELGGYGYGYYRTVEDPITHELEDQFFAEQCGYFNLIVSQANAKLLYSPNENTIDYLADIDELVLGDILLYAYPSEDLIQTITFEDEFDYHKFTTHIEYYSYLKYVSSNDDMLWSRWVNRYHKVLNDKYPAEKCMSSDFVTFYRENLNAKAAQYRTCMATTEGKYGTYGYYDNGIYVEAKSWKYAWNQGFFEGLLVYPIGWLIDTIAIGFNNSGVAAGAAALLSIFFVTLIVRLLMMAATIKQTAGNAKMTELQPQVTKIQNKYPNANSNQYEKQRMAQEINDLYKKNKINPLSTLLVLIIQFPVFICVWGALSGSSILTNGSFLGLSLGVSIREAMFESGSWTAAGGYAGVTAFFLFLFMSVAQAVSMLLPQWMQKKKAKQVAKLGKNPSQKSQNNKMKWVTYIMLALIIFMGFSLVSAMGVYWLVGAVISIAQTLIMQVITSKKAKNKI